MNDNTPIKEHQGGQLLTYRRELFVDSLWRALWWKCFAGKESAEALSFPAEQEGTEAQEHSKHFYSHQVVHGGVLRSRRIEPIGAAYGRPDVFPSEFLDAWDDLSPLAWHQGLLSHLVQASWDEFVVPNVCPESSLVIAIQNWAKALGYRTEVVDPSNYYAVDVAGSFDRYCRALSPSSRRAMINKRQLASRLGVVRESFTGGEALRHYDEFHYLHHSRWAASGMGPASHRFVRSLFVIDPAHWTAELSFLRCDGRPVSALVNVAMNGVTYNLQGGFLSGFDPRISLGILHLGLEVELAFKDQHMRFFDMLAGHGKTCDYKAKLCDQRYRLVTLRVVRAKHLAALKALKRRLTL